MSPAADLRVGQRVLVTAARDFVKAPGTVTHSWTHDGVQGVRVAIDDGPHVNCTARSCELLVGGAS